MTEETRKAINLFYSSSDFSVPVTGAEAILIKWLQDGTEFTPEYAEPSQLVEALNPRDGGYDLEAVNLIRQVHHEAVLILQKRVMEWAQLEIPAPAPLTAEDFLKAWQEIEAKPETA